MKSIRLPQFLLAAAAVALLLGGGNLASAQLHWFDDWSDGDYADGDPVTWTTLDFTPGDYDASSGDFVLTGVFDTGDNEAMAASVEETSFPDHTSVRARTLVVDRGENPEDTASGDVGVVARYDFGSVSGYIAVLDVNNFLTVFRSDLGFAENILTVSDTGYSAADDVMIQLDVSGPETNALLEVTLWDPDEPMPDAPQYSAFDETGFGGLDVGTAGIIFVEGNNDSSGVFRWAEAADERLGPIDPSEDADFNGDGVVDGDDFLIWQGGFGAPGMHEDGDANFDDLVDGNDFLIWQAQFGGGDGSAAVPEPASAALAALIAIFAGVAVRRRHA